MMMCLSLSRKFIAILILLAFSASYAWAQEPSTPQNYLVVSGDTTNRQQVEPSVAIDPLDENIIVASAQDMRRVPEFGNRWNSYYRSIDGGKTWYNALIPGYPTDISKEGLASPLRQFQFTSDPVVAFDSSGNAYFAGLAANQTFGISAVFVTRYSTHGSYYEYTTIAHSGSRENSVGLDKPYLFVDNTWGSSNFGSIYMTWTEYSIRTGRLSIYFSMSKDMGMTFSSPLLLSDGKDFVNQFTAIATGGDGSVYVTWVSWSRFQTTVKLAKSQDGVLFTAPKNIAYINPIPRTFPNNGFRVMSFPAIAVDTNDAKDNVYIAWSDWNGMDSDILLMRSEDKGETWSSPVVVNDVSRNNQFMPAITVSNGKIYAVFYDSRLDTSLRANQTLDVFYAVSSDHGRSFGRNERVTTSSFNPNAVCRCPVFNAPFLGDYIAISATGSNVIAIWTDNRNTSPLQPLNQDVYVAKLEQIKTNLVPYSKIAATGITNFVNGYIRRTAPYIPLEPV